MRGALLATSALVLVDAGGLPIARADDFQGIGFVNSNDLESHVNGISSNGLTAVGRIVDFSGHSQASVWTQAGGMFSLGFLDNNISANRLSIANGASADGSVVVGDGRGTGDIDEAFRWTQAGGMVGLGFLAPLSGQRYSFGYGTNSDGSIVVGESLDTNGFIQAYRWTQATGMVGIGFLSPNTNPRNSHANGISANGNVIVGTSLDTSGFDQAFKWDQTNGMVGIGFLAPSSGLRFSNANAANSDGSVIVGNARSQSGFVEAFRWTQSGGMLGLGWLPGGGNGSTAVAVSADGSVVVGVSDSANYSGGEAFKWTQAAGIKSVKDLLVASGVNMTGWSLLSATGVSGDGTVIVGEGVNPSLKDEAWIARFGSTPGSSGLITQGVAQQSFSGQSVNGTLGNAVLGGSLGTMTEVATQSSSSQGTGNTPYSAFASSAYDSDPAASGTMGITVDLPHEMIAGVMFGANYSTAKMVYDGSSKFWGGSAGAFIGRDPRAGLQWFLGADATTQKGDIKRGYLNGAAEDSSNGSTTATGGGATARIGWTFDKLAPKTRITPFASYSYSAIRFNAYTETGGAFPAQLDAFTDVVQTSRLGADARYTLQPGKWLWGTLAWAHRLNGNTTTNITGSLIGLFAINAPGTTVAQDWAEITGGVRLPLGTFGAATASVTAVTPVHYPTTYVARLGVTKTY
ncbi:MAG: autotransporter domain-containing protein [Pseudolabrys sp.]